MSPDPLVLCAPILLAETCMYTGKLTNCTEAMTWPDYLKTACSGSTAHYIPPPAFGLWVLYTQSSSHTT